MQVRSAVNSGADWQQADPRFIASALERASAKPSGGWFVVDATRALRTRSRTKRALRPRRYQVDGRQLVSFVDTKTDAIVIAPARCPHMGADLGDGRVNTDGCIVCPWHGLTLPNNDEYIAAKWSPFRSYDDGVLTWVQFDPNAPDATSAPILPKRPDRFLTGVIRRDAMCEPRDVIANRLDPWHGVHFHPYAFAHLEVIDQTPDAIELRVGYRVTPWHVIPVVARFDCSDPRTIVMTIIDGEGMGSVVETHATPMVHASPGVAPRTAIIEATLATSERPGFAYAMRGAPIARPMIAFFANRLWNDDARYAERLWALRAGGGAR